MLHRCIFIKANYGKDILIVDNFYLIFVFVFVFVLVNKRGVIPPGKCDTLMLLKNGDISVYIGNNAKKERKYIQ